MGIFSAIKESMEKAAERERLRLVSQHVVEDAMTKHNREHRDDLVLMHKSEVPVRCPTGKYGWDGMVDVPLGKTPEFCLTCAKWHEKSGV